MRLPNSEYSDRPWRTHEIASDFRIEDVWKLPTPGGPDDLAKFARMFTEDKDDSRVVNAFLELRWKIGRLFGLDSAEQGVGKRVQPLHDRLPPDLRDGPRGPDFRSVPFRSVFITNNEWLCEMANWTVHALLHVGWVQDDTGGYYGQMTALVRPNGLFGKAYMAGVLPLRRAFIYPLLLRSLGRAWEKERQGP
jgi:hypothetical protein